jgi:hypothetical protein
MKIDKELLAEIHPDIPYKLVEDIAKLVTNDDEKQALFLIIKIRNSLKKAKE